MKAIWASRIARLCKEIDRHFADGASLYESRECRMVIIELNSTWERTVREFMLFYGARHRFKTPKPTRSQKSSVISNFLTTAGRQRELNWLIPTEVIHFSRTIGLPEHGSILGVLGKSPWTLDHLRHYRNFIAHESEESARKLGGNCSPILTPALKHFPFEMERGAPRFRNWVAEMNIVLGALPN